MLNILDFKVKLAITIVLIIVWAILLVKAVIESKRDSERELSQSVFGSTTGKLSWACLIAAGVIFVIL